MNSFYKKTSAACIRRRPTEPQRYRSQENVTVSPLNERRAQNTDQARKIHSVYFNPSFEFDCANTNTCNRERDDNV